MGGSLWLGGALGSRDQSSDNSMWCCLSSVPRITTLSLFGPKLEKRLQAGSDGLQRCARHGTHFFRVTCLGVDCPHLMWQYHALDRKSRRDRDLQIVAGAIGAAAMRSDGTYDGKSESALQRVH